MPGVCRWARPRGRPHQPMFAQDISPTDFRSQGGRPNPVCVRSVGTKWLERSECVTENADSARDTPHVPVLLDQALHWLAPRAGGLYVDATFGAGGYTKAILRSADTRVIAIDRDRT